MYRSRYHAQLILTINGGSSSLKFALFPAGEPAERTVAGKFERIGSGEVLVTVDGSGAKTITARDHGACVPVLMEIIGKPQVQAVAHRIVHGGTRYFNPELVTPAMLEYLRTLREFVPEHLPAEIQLLEVLREYYAGVPHVACFDTGFHRDMPRLAQLLPIPRRYEKLGVRRYGFHGLSYSCLMIELERVGEAHGRLILAHLGNGCSMAAVRDGKCVDTTMSFTPAAGLVMGRRTGDLDPGLVAWLARTEGITPEEFNRIVNTRSGLLGISETTSDVRDLLQLEKTDVRAAEALGVFCYQARKWIGALAVAAGGLDTLVFAGGIGENAAPVRERICSGLSFLGITVDPERNAAGAPVISTDDSRVRVRIIRTDEELYMARCARVICGLS
jgi:acetate kinase